MAFCEKCGAQISEGCAFCGHCGAKFAPAHESVCKNCGEKLEDGMFFCSKCGTRVESNDGLSYASAPSKPAVQPTAQSTVEQELYRRKMLGYCKGLTQLSGEMIITNKKIMFIPMAIHLLHQPFTIGMNEILSVSRASMMGMNLCVRVNTTGGQSHIFSFGIINMGDIDRVVDIINRTKQTA